MALLHNRVSRSALKARVEDDPTPRITLSFYKYILLADPQDFRNQLYAAWTPLQVFGRIYVASEGINAQLSVPQQNFEAFKDQLYALPGFEGLRLNTAVEENRKSFFVLDIKVRKKIVADGIDDPLFDVHRNGQYVDAATFNQLADQPGTYVIDMRNHYEYEVGHFRTAIEIPSDTFREQLPMAAEMMAGQEDKTIIMYCTGGIRCEKASAYLRHRGFQKVFHLEGGIIHYTQQVKALQLPNQFIGKNFVFDDRLGERISSDIIAQCHQC
ncbi:MAG: rhodanese-related sulfurtransferase, partial [Chitinophagaceae bacterium]